MHFWSTFVYFCPESKVVQEENDQCMFLSYFVNFIIFLFLYLKCFNKIFVDLLIFAAPEEKKIADELWFRKTQDEARGMWCTYVVLLYSRTETEFDCIWFALF